MLPPARIGHIHLCDTDMKTRLNMFGTKCDFGEGIIDFDELMPVLAERYDGEWWAVDSIPMGAKAWKDTWNGVRQAQRRSSTSTSAEGRRRAMKAAVFYDVEDIRLEDVPEPELGADDVLVEVSACGICGSDLEYYYGRSPVGTADGKGPLDPRPRVLPARSSQVGKDADGRWPRATASRSTRSSRSAVGRPRRSGNPHFDLHRRCSA